MNSEEGYKLLEKHHPTGFLEQLGEKLDQVVGLGEPKLVRHYNERTGQYERFDTVFPVLALGNAIGSYGVGLKQGNAYDFIYHGSFPHNIPKSDCTTLLYNPERTAIYGSSTSQPACRLDLHNDVIFPGFGIIDTNHSQN